MQIQVLFPLHSVLPVFSECRVFQCLGAIKIMSAFFCVFTRSNSATNRVKEVQSYQNKSYTWGLHLGLQVKLDSQCWLPYQLPLHVVVHCIVAQCMQTLHCFHKNSIENVKKKEGKKERLCGWKWLTGAHVAAAVTHASAPGPWATHVRHHWHHLGWLLLNHRNLHKLLLGHDICSTAQKRINRSIHISLHIASSHPKASLNVFNFQRCIGQQ